MSNDNIEIFGKKLRVDAQSYIGEISRVQIRDSEARKPQKSFSFNALKFLHF